MKINDKSHNLIQYCVFLDLIYIALLLLYVYITLLLLLLIDN